MIVANVLPKKDQSHLEDTNIELKEAIEMNPIMRLNCCVFPYTDGSFNTKEANVSVITDEWYF